MPSCIMHPHDKLRREVAIVRFVKEKTKSPVPKVVTFGTTANNHDPSIGSFLITEWVEGLPATTVVEELP